MPHDARTQPKGCMDKFSNFFSSLNPWRKKEIIIPSGFRDLGMVLQNARFGDILLMRTKTKVDSAVAMSSYIASDVALCTQCACLIPEKVQFRGWDHAALIIRDPEISKHEHYLLEIDRWGFHAYELLERMRYHERQGNEIAIIPINIEVKDEDKVYSQLVKPFLDMTHKRAIERGSQITSRVFEKIKAYTKQVDTESKLYKEYQRKFRFFLQGDEYIFPKEVKSFLKLLIDPYLTMEMIEDFMQAHTQTLIEKDKIDFDFLYSLMKPELLSYKSFYEINMDTVVCAEMLVQFLFALGVVSLPEFVEHLSVLTCDMLVDLPTGLPNVTLSQPYYYSGIIRYFIPPAE